MFESRDATREAQENARRHEKAYHETLVFLKRAQTKDPATANQVDRAFIQLLEAQLNNANQQLQSLRAERAPNASDAQMAAQQSWTNEQLEALHAEIAELHKTIGRLAEERDRTRRANVHLQLQSLKDKAALNADCNALRAQCLQAKAEVEELKGKIDLLEKRGGYRESPTTTSAALGPYYYPALGGLGGELTAQASPHLGGAMSGLGMPQVPTLPPAGRGLSAYLARSSTRSASSTPFPSPGTGSGLSVLAPSPYLGAPYATAGAMDTEGAGQAPRASAVTTGAASTTTNQDPAQAGSRPSPQ